MISKAFQLGLRHAGAHLAIFAVAAGTLVALTAAGCGPSNGVNSPAPPHVASVKTNVLQLAVGTANIYGDAGAGVAATGLNVVTTYRQGPGNTAPGDSGSSVNSPTFTVAGTLPATAPTADPFYATIDAGGPAPGESTAMKSTAQTATNVTTFGVTGQVSGLGLEPSNYNQLGATYTVAPYPVPVYDALSVTGGDPNQIPSGWGGPPAFDLLGNGQSPVGNGGVPPGYAGLSMGLDVFEGLAPVAGGTYTMAVALPTNIGTLGTSKSFTLPTTLTTLPSWAPPPAPTLDASGDGGATFAVTLPAGVTEAYVEVVDYGPVPTAPPSPAGATPPPEPSSCNGATDTAPVYYTIEGATSGTYTLGPAAGPGGAPSICTAAANTTANGATATPGDVFTVQGLGFDYPAFESSYPSSLGNPSPAILGAKGEDDITISSAPAYQELAADARLRTFVHHPALQMLRRPAQSIRTR